ncbi:ABC transporter, ATP-binding protein [hydrothermal vent metagenome]|uniref:ABC transporter, ATP-binding protein n=1 Tax=hydrothermal vent metagenome TaxID=652676 RepID=A0A3B0TLJ1_9ZZZZ
MARLTVERATKRFGDFAALDTTSLEAEDGEFLAVLGPSGCGKSTLLRLVAGFETLTEGQITIGERVVSAGGVHIPPEHRKVGIVFQNYALWPHMTVAENVGYSLRVNKVAGPERRRRVHEALELVDLIGFEDRKPGLLSGGQRQRVALARCLVAAPSLVLLDEPLANLDVHLRASMEREFSDFHRQTGTTMIYITHDQAEAMALADRIAVMDEGKIVQIATPSALYREPATQMVARFIGQGMVLPAKVLKILGDGRCQLEFLGQKITLRCGADSKPGPANICLKSNALSIDGKARAAIAGTITYLIYRGGYRRAEIALDGASELNVSVDIPEGVAVHTGQAVKISIDDGWVVPPEGMSDR